MLTLQQLLESDSIAAIVAKLNNNFQILSNSNGGPQGIRGPQGIPGLPGRIGPLGPTGAQGPTGTLVGIIPFACVSDSTAGVGPTAGQLADNSQATGEWPLASWTWLMSYHGGGIISSFTGLTSGTGATATNGDIYVDHSNQGYWKFLTSQDVPGACTGGTGSYPDEYLNGGAYSYLAPATGTYPDFSAGLGFVGPGWYWYPTAEPASGVGTQVWVNDVTSYLFGLTAGPYTGTNPLSVPNARLVSKYGSVWITSGSDNILTDDDLSTSDIQGWGSTGGQYNPARINSGVDRLLFKMSIDTLPYSANITARGFTALSGQAYLNSTTHPVTSSGTVMTGVLASDAYWIKPQYEKTIDKYSPLLFFSERNPDGWASPSNYSSLGLYMHTSINDNQTKDNLNKSLFLWSTRYAPDPVEMFPAGFTGIDSASTKNYGEFIIDTRRLITSNQYVCSIPSDMKLSGDWINYSGPEFYYEESNLNNPYRYRTYQGYISSVNGKSVTGNPGAINYWEYGLGDTGTQGLTAGTHDTASGVTGMQTRNTWYGSSVFDELPSNWDGLSPGDGNYIRLSGMMERGRRFLDDTVYSDETHFLSELIFYTSHFKKDLLGAFGVTNSEIDPTINEHKSLPVLYMSPFRNVGIGTFVGDTYNTNDKGPLEPAAQFHVHAKQKLREDDPSYTYIELPEAGSNRFPNRIFTVAAFSGDYTSVADNSATDILLGNLYTQNEEWIAPNLAIGDMINRMSDSATGTPGVNVLRNAIRTESWRFSRHNTLRFGVQTILSNNAIGKGDVDFYKNEFQLSIHPLIKDISLDESDSNQSISGIGIHNLYPRTRVHIFGKNVYNEVDWGEEAWRPGYMTLNATGSYPHYAGKLSINSPSSNQITMDYIGDSYVYPVGIYDYQYYAYGATANPGSTGSVSPNSAVYPSRDSITPTRHAVPFGITGANESYPSTGIDVAFNGSYKHGGTANAWWEPTSYIGFNLFRDVSEASTSGGDDRDNTRWILGRSDNGNATTGNNGGSAFISSPHGELGIINIPRGRDGGHPYTQWEQRGLGTRDVLNQMKIVFDRNGNIAVGNAAGWDMDAYPSLDRDSNGYLQYVPTVGATATAPATAGSNLAYTWEGLWNTADGQYGLLTYSGYAENSSTSSAALINANATQPEYIRLEVAAEKAWSRDGRMAQKTGWGYPPNATLVISGAAAIDKYVDLSSVTTGLASWTLVTDNEGRIITSTLALGASNPGLSVTDFPVVVYPHPTEFEDSAPLSLGTGFVAPAGAIAAEWWGMSIDNPADDINDTIVIISDSGATFIPTTDLRGSANVRLNNFVYGEGYGFGGPGGQTADNTPDNTDVADFTKNLVKQKRQESPKLIFTFLEGDVDSGKAAIRGAAGADPYKKVSTTIQSAQNEVSLREYWVPKADNSGGTFMVFTDHFGSKEKNDGFDDTSIKVETTPTGGGTAASGLHLDQVVTMEFLAGYTGTEAVITNKNTLLANIDGASAFGLVSNMYPGYVRYSNRDYLWPGQQSTAFGVGEYARKKSVGDLDATSDILQLGADRDGQYTIIKIESPDTNYAIQNNTTEQIGDADNSVLIKPDTNNGLVVFSNAVIEDSDYDYAVSGLTGSVASSINSSEVIFYPNLNPLPNLITPDRIKITIDFAAAADDTTLWPSRRGPLYIGLIPDDAAPSSLWNKAQMINSCLLPGYYGMIWPSVGPIAQTAIVFENQINFYIPYNAWENYSTWKLGLMLRQNGDLDDLVPTINEFVTIAEPLKIAKFEIKFEEVYDPTNAAYQETSIVPLTTEVANLAAVHRNVDHFYSIHAVGTDNNKSSAIRFKRINSEFALVDFNITVKVDNPTLPGGSTSDAHSYIDLCSPRFTQSLRFVYVPDEDFDTEPTYRQDIAQDIFGNGMWFGQWSRYKQWYTGTAVVGADTAAPNDYYDTTVPSTVGTNLRNTGDSSPYYTDGLTNNFRTWNGNYLDVLSHYIFAGAGTNTFKEHSIYKSEGSITPLTDVYNNTVLAQRQKSGVYSAFGSDRRILQIAKAMFNQVGIASEAGAKQLGFVNFLGAAYSVWHNHTYMRNKNIQWRMVPARSYIYEQGAGQSLLPQNNSFVLEVQFSDPMLHVDTPLGQRAFIGTGGVSDTGRYYQYLTVSGQSIVRYAETTADDRSGIS